MQSQMQLRAQLRKSNEREEKKILCETVSSQ